MDVSQSEKNYTLPVEKLLLSLGREAAVVLSVCSHQRKRELGVYGHDIKLCVITCELCLSVVLLLMMMMMRMVVVVMVVM